MKHAFFALILGLGFAAGAPAAPAAPVFVDGAWLEKQLPNPKVVLFHITQDQQPYFPLPPAGRGAPAVRRTGEGT